MHRHILISIVTILCLILINYTFVAAQPLGSQIVRSFGTISYVLPLHIEGPNIKDEFDNIVILKGMQKHGFEDDPEGRFADADGYGGYWNRFDESVVRDNFRAMRSWGANEVRVIFRASFWLNNPTGNTGTHFRDCIKQLIEIAGEEGLYVVFCGFSLEGPAGHHNIPWGTSTFPTLQDFVDFWRDIATELKDYPNVLFELWNEMAGDKDVWFDGVNTTIQAIRDITDHIIVVQYQYDVWARYNEYESNYSLDEWVTDPRIQGENILFSTHAYHDTRGIWVEGGVESWLWEYEDVEQAYIDGGLLWHVNTFQKPLYIGEYGPWAVEAGFPRDNVWISSENGLKILNQWNISYNIMWWHDTNPPDGDYSMYSSPGFQPNAWGQIVQDALLESP